MSKKVTPAKFIKLVKYLHDFEMYSRQGLKPQSEKTFLESSLGPATSGVPSWWRKLMEIWNGYSVKQQSNIDKKFKEGGGENGLAGFTRNYNFSFKVPIVKEKKIRSKKTKSDLSQEYLKTLKSQFVSNYDELQKKLKDLPPDSAAAIMVRQALKAINPTGELPTNMPVVSAIPTSGISPPIQRPSDAMPVTAITATPVVPKKYELSKLSGIYGSSKLRAKVQAEREATGSPAMVPSSLNLSTPPKVKFKIASKPAVTKPVPASIFKEAKAKKVKVKVKVKEKKAKAKTVKLKTTIIPGQGVLGKGGKQRKMAVGNYKGAVPKPLPFWDKPNPANKPFAPPPVPGPNPFKTAWHKATGVPPTPEMTPFTPPKKKRKKSSKK